ncbi:MAG: hypothetical protein WD766_07800 [Gemmatimonadota bacterium]
MQQAVRIEAGTRRRLEIELPVDAVILRGIYVNARDADASRAVIAETPAGISSPMIRVSGVGRARIRSVVR